jgi:hypothetical protein
MQFTVTSGVGVTEVVDRPESARAALERVLLLLGRKRNDVRIFDEEGWRRTPADLCRLAAGKLQCCPMIKTELQGLASRSARKARHSFGETAYVHR